MITLYERIAEYLVELAGDASLLSGREIQVFPHFRVDGDCIGSAAALVLAMRKLGLQSRFYLAEPIPENLRFMMVEESLYCVFDSECLEEYAKLRGIAVAVDCSEAQRMADPGILFARAEKVIVLDHHVSSGESQGLKLVDGSVSSTAEMILTLYDVLEAKTGISFLDAVSANHLMVGIQSDTGRFSYQNTTPKSLRCAARLMEAGANVYENGFHLFEETDSSTLKLNSEALANASFYADGKIVITTVTRTMLETYDVPDEAVDGLVSTLRGIRGVMVSFVVRETKEGELRVNIRSNAPFDASAFAAFFGGGGHLRAAGFTKQGMSAQQLSKDIIERACIVAKETEG